jgi:hypothetical protein
MVRRVGVADLQSLVRERRRDAEKRDERERMAFHDALPLGIAVRP